MDQGMVSIPPRCAGSNPLLSQSYTGTVFLKIGHRSFIKTPPYLVTVVVDYGPEKNQNQEDRR